MTTAPKTAAPSTAVALAPAASQALLAKVTGNMRDPARITAALAQAAEHFHVVSPVTSCPVLPEGVSIAMSAVMVYANGNDVYPIPGSDKVGLGKSALDRLAMNMGISWSAQESRRLDDGAHPYYCAYQAVGHYPAWDGSRATTMATKEVDLRDGSPAVTAMWDRYHEKLAAWERGGKHGYAPKSPENELRQARLHVMAMAESKAKNRAVRALGIRTSYTKAELSKPFLVARAMFTGETSDPELKRAFALMTAERMLGASTRLFGPSPEPSRRALSQGTPAPPVESVVDHDEDGVVEGEWDPSPSRAPAPAAAAPADPRYSQTVSRQEPRPAPAPGGDDAPPAGFFDEDDHDAAEPEPAPAGQRSGLVIPGGRAKGTPIEDAEERDLTYWAGRIEGDLADGKTREAFVDRDTKLAQAMRDELARRGA